MPSLYVHIPFCKAKCHYCDFSSYTGKEDQMCAYTDALLLEAEYLAGLGKGTVFDTIFFGGGTPSLLPPIQLQRIIQSLFLHYTIAQDAEITLECNPGATVNNNFSAYKSMGINRLSIGLQSMEDILLKRIGRIHSKEDFINTFYAARQAGFVNINIDVMYGLPGQTRAHYQNTLRALFSLSPTHISCYELILEEGTRLYHDISLGKECLPKEDEILDMQESGMAMLEEQGYMRYEISNYAKPGCRCRHNLNYWHNGEYLGLGSSAHSAWRIHIEQKQNWTRFENEKSIADYIQTATSPVSLRNLNIISWQNELFETVMMGLRLTEGICLQEFAMRFKCAFESLFPNSIGRLTSAGWLIKNPNSVYLTRAGLNMQNTALVYFLEELTESKKA